MVEMHLPPEHVFMLSSAPFHPFPTPFSMRAISWQRWCPHTNPADGCPLWPQMQELNCSHSDTPHLYPLLGLGTAHILVKYLMMRLQRETSENAIQTFPCLAASEGHAPRALLTEAPPLLQYLSHPSLHPSLQAPPSDHLRPV